MQQNEHQYSVPITKNAGIFQQRKRLLPVSLFILFMLAFGIRVMNLDASRLLAERQFRSAIIARTFFFDGKNDIPEWRRQVALLSNQRSVVLEPPILEYFASIIYRLINKENVLIARLLSSIFWMIGGVFLYKIIKKAFSVDVAIFGTAYYLLVPIGFVVSISFLPDSLMIMALITSIFMIVKYFEAPKMFNLIMAAVISGLAILIKPLVMFMILGAFIFLAFFKKLSLKNLVAFIGISLFLGTSYYFYGIFIEKSVAPQAEASFLPALLLQPDYWRRWILTAVGAVGVIPLAIALVGVPLMPHGLPRTLLVGLWTGYVIFCLVFTYHIRFAGHYHLQLVVVIALSVGPVMALLINRLTHFSDKWYWWIPIIGAILLAMAFSIREMRHKLASFLYFESKQVSQEIGEIVGHSMRTVHIASYYGTPLEYYAELSGTYWPRSVSDTDRALGFYRERSVEERLDSLGYTPEFFIITNFNEYENYHDDLNLYLVENCQVFAKTDQYLIYDSCSK